MSDLRNASYQALVGALDGTPLPAAQTEPLRAALAALFDDRPNAMDKIRQPLGRALRNPMFPEIWEQCVGDIPKSAAYADLRSAAEGIASFVAAARA
ncbi:MAG: hypothetical protein H6732_04365 [Alphaproteobacteria bacterium]|nr:hypothetical protein [Alphaproteobacteria bacterium]